MRKSSRVWASAIAYAITLVAFSFPSPSSALSATSVTFFYTDAQGTVLAVADAQGNVTQQFDYTPYGREVMGVAMDGPGYTGHMSDLDSGLIYMKARYYDPDIGRFLSVDVYKASAGDPFSTNLYVYARAAPSMLVDPDGRQAKAGNDLDICSGPVPCDLNVSYGSNGNIAGPYDKIVDRVFQTYQVTSAGTAAPSDQMPAELRTALIYIIGAPMGKALVQEALASGQQIGLIQIPATMRPDMRFDHGSGLIMYTLNIAAYKAQFMNNPVLAAEVRGQTLDVMLAHEIAHTPLGRRAFGIQARPSTMEDEFEDVRRVENPYRAFYGVPVRTTYSGKPVP